MKPEEVKKIDIIVLILTLVPVSCQKLATHFSFIWGQYNLCPFEAAQ